MKKYQEPQMDILELEIVDTIVASTLELPEDGSNTGGNESGDWGDFWD